MRGRIARECVLWEHTLLVALSKNGANMATGERLFTHPPSARTRAASGSAMRLTAPRPCKWPSEWSLCRRPNACSAFCGLRGFPDTQWVPGVKSVVTDSNRASNLYPDPASGNLLHHRSTQSILQATSYFEPTPLAHSTRAQAKVTRSATPVVQVCASNRDASAALCCLTDSPRQHKN